MRFGVKYILFIQYISEEPLYQGHIFTLKWLGEKNK